MNRIIFWFLHKDENNIPVSIVKDKLIYNRNLYFSFNLKETFKNWFIY